MHIPLSAGSALPGLVCAALLVGCGNDSNFTGRVDADAIPNEPPSAPEVVIAPDDPYTLDDLLAEITVEAEDPDGDALTYRYAWSVDGQPVDADGESIGSAETAVDQVWQVQVRANDGVNEGEPATAEVTILNTPPALTALEILPDGPTTVDFLTCVPSSFDEDGHAVTYSYVWDVNGELVGADEPELVPSAFQRGDTVTCTVTPLDDREAGEPDSVSVVIGNAPPEVVGVEIEPSPARTTDTLTCIASGYDPDDDAVSLDYAWTVDGVAAGTGSVLVSTAFVKDQTVTCTVTPSDGTDEGSPSSASLVIENTPPGAPGVEIVPAEPTVDDDLVCTVVTASADADLDAITYSVSWEVDGSVFGGTAETTTLTGDTVRAVETSQGEEWTCIVVPNDGEVDGPSASDTVTVSEPKDFTLFTTARFLGSGSGSWLTNRAAADDKCEDEADRLGLSGSDWRIVYSNPDEDAADYLLYDADRGDRVYDRDGRRIDGGDLWGSGRISLPDLQSWTITGTGKSGAYKECSGSYSAGTWPICQYCARKFACASSSDDPFNPGSCCWTGTRAIVCMGVKD